MGLKILHSADWHLGSPFRQFSPAHREYLKQEQRKIPQKIADLCRREHCQMVLLSGDIFDGQPSRDLIDLVKNTLRSCGVPVLISPGNHDFCTTGSPWLENDWSENVIIFNGALSSVAFPQLDCRIYGAGYQSMDCPGLLEGFRTMGTERYHIAVLHGDPIQTGSPYCPITASQVRSSGLQYLALGHIHKAGAFRSGNTLCAWPGCPMGRGWDETGSKGVCIVTIGSSAQVQAVTMDTPRFHALEADVGSDAIGAMETLLPAGETQDFYRVTLTGSGYVSPSELYRHFDRIPHLEILDHTEEPQDLWTDAEEDSLEGVFFRMLRTAAENDPDHAEQIRLAAEISRKLLSGREVIV